MYAGAQEAVSRLQEGAGLSRHLRGDRDHGGPRAVRQRSQEQSVYQQQQQQQ